MDEIQEAQQQFEQQVERSVREAAADLVTRGLAEWRLDPVVPRVVGLVRTGTNTALVVVYLEDEDLEVSEDLLD